MVQMNNTQYRKKENEMLDRSNTRIKFLINTGPVQPGFAWCEDCTEKYAVHFD